MKKGILYFLMMGLVVSLAACGDSTTIASTTTTTTTTTTSVQVAIDTWSSSTATTIGELFTKAGSFYADNASCGTTGCHDGNTDASAHQLDMRSYTAITVEGADQLEADPYVSILGQANNEVASLTEFPSNWGSSKLKARLRNTRMPPGWTWDATEANRDGVAILAVGAWVGDGAIEAGTSSLVGYDTLLASLAYSDSTMETVTVDDGSMTAIAGSSNDWPTSSATTIGELFTKAGAFYTDSSRCSTTGCHDGNTDASAHQLDMGSYTAITVEGADQLEADPYVSILGQANNEVASLTEFPPNWGSSKLKARLRNTRMPPGWTWDATEANRDGVAILAVGAWVADGAIETGTSTLVGYDTLLASLMWADSAMEAVEVAE